MEIVCDYHKLFQLFRRQEMRCNKKNDICNQDMSVNPSILTQLLCTFCFIAKLGHKNYLFLLLRSWP